MDSQTEEQVYISARQLAIRWDCSRNTAHRTAKRAGITKVFLGEGRNGIVRYSLEEIVRYEISRAIGVS